MTINEQLQFSVLTTPVAALDRRSLSQAWYSALYGNGGASAANHSNRNRSQTSDVRSVRAQALPVTARESSQRAALRSHTRASAAHIEAVPSDRRAPRSPLARKIERAFLRPKALAHKASFAVEGDGGRVHVLLRSQGARLRLIAICPPKARSQVAAALAQARYALALRGIDLDAAARSEATC